VNQKTVLYDLPYDGVNPANLEKKADKILTVLVVVVVPAAAASCSSSGSRQTDTRSTASFPGQPG